METGRPKVLVTMPQNESMNLFMTDKVRNFLESFAEVEWNLTEKEFTGQELAEKIEDKEYALTGWGCHKFDEDVLKNAAALKMIAHAGGSVGMIADHSVYDRGILVASGNEIMAESVAEGALSYILMGLRRSVHFANGMQAGGWKNGLEWNQSLLRQKVGIISLGSISNYLIQMLKPFHAEILVYSRKRDERIAEKLGISYASLEEIFKTCKVISVHTASNSQTYHMIGKELIGMISDGAVFVNTSRGAVVDEQALTEELLKNRFYAVLDVYEKEPLSSDSPLRGLDNVILMPHCGGPTLDLREHIGMKMAEEIKNHLEGKALTYLISNEKAQGMTTKLKAN